jgi:hypothetical protein
VGAGLQSRPREARFRIISAKTKVIHAVVCKNYAALGVPPTELC